MPAFTAFFRLTRLLAASRGPRVGVRHRPGLEPLEARTVLSTAAPVAPPVPEAPVAVLVLPLASPSALLAVNPAAVAPAAPSTALDGAFRSLALDRPAFQEAALGLRPGPAPSLTAGVGGAGDSTPPVETAAAAVEDLMWTHYGLFAEDCSAIAA